MARFESNASDGTITSAVSAVTPDLAIYGYVVRRDDIDIAQFSLDMGCFIGTCKTVRCFIGPRISSSQ